MKQARLSTVLTPELCRKDYRVFTDSREPERTRERCCLTQAVCNTTGLFVVPDCHSSPPTLLPPPENTLLLEAKDPQRQV